MGFFDRFFSKESSDSKFVRRHVQRLLNKYGQKEIREDSMYALAQKGTPEAISGLLQRFTYNHPDSIVDEREKNKIIDLLESLGAEKASDPLHQYLADTKQSSISMALIAYDQLMGDDATILEILKLLEDSDPNDAWSSERKMQLIGHLDGIEKEDAPPELAPMLLRFIGDLDDDVIFRCIELLEQIGSDEQIRESFIEIFMSEETSMRIRARIIETVKLRKWYIGDRRKEIEDLLPDGYYFDKRGNLKQREP